MKYEEWVQIGFVPGYGTTTERNNYSFIDENVSPGFYQYRLKQIDFDGSFSYSNTVELEFTSLLKFELYQNYPNPFNPNTRISWQLPVSSNVTLKIFNAVGEEIKTLVDNEFQDAGSHSSLPSGVYFYKLEAGNFVKINKMVLIK